MKPAMQPVSVMMRCIRSLQHTFCICGGDDILRSSLEIFAMQNQTEQLLQRNVTHCNVLFFHVNKLHVGSGEMLGRRVFWRELLQDIFWFLLARQHKSKRPLGDLRPFRTQILEGKRKIHQSLATIFRSVVGTKGGLMSAN